MHVSGLFIKPYAGEPVQPHALVQLLPGYGIQGDSNAQVGSPRQVLILDVPTLDLFGLQPGDLRENILLSEGLAEMRSGLGLHIGNTLIRLTFRCEPCAFLETLQPGLTRRIKDQRGWLGMVIAGGTIALGADATLTPHPIFPGLPDDAKSRFYDVVATIPPGKVATTKDLILSMGVTSAHYRVIPTFMKRAPTHLPVHRVVAIDGSLMTKHLPHQAESLMAEGVQVMSDRVQQCHYWLPEHYYNSQP